tara:strand:- start:513 stop:701 length:189 start_codon:yes stop_codon:yes gene_type:complete
MITNKDTIEALKALYSTVIKTHPRLRMDPSKLEATRSFIESLCKYLSELDGDGLSKNKIMNN